MNLRFWTVLGKIKILFRMKWQEFACIAGAAAVLMTANTYVVESIATREYDKVAQEYGFDATEMFFASLRHLPGLLTGNSTTEHLLENEMREWEQQVIIAMKAYGEKDPEVFLGKIVAAYQAVEDKMLFYDLLSTLVLLALCIALYTLSLLLAGTNMQLRNAWEQILVVSTRLIAEYSVIFFRTFGWMALLGFLIFLFAQGFRLIGLTLFVGGMTRVIVTSPRYIFAPVLLVEGKNVMESAVVSYKQTEGQWLRIVMHMTALNAFLIGGYFLFMILLLLAPNALFIPVELCRNFLFACIVIIQTAYIIVLRHT